MSWACRKQGILFLLCLVLLIPSHRLHASRDLLPLIDQKTLMGMWEGIDSDGFRIWRLEVRSMREAWLAFALPEGYDDVYRLKSLTQKGDEFQMKFQSLSQEISLELTVAGRGDSNEGQLEAILFLHGPGPQGDAVPRRFRLFRCCKTLGVKSYAELLKRMADDAERAVQKARAPKSTKPKTENAR